MTGRTEPVIGLEVHVQLATDQKLFCRCSPAFGSEPNTRVCPLCLGLPGALPVTNGGAVELAVRAALGLECTVHETSVFARKNYFYPDLPKGYQISQFERPLATGGRLVVEEGGESFAVRIRRLHLEEDAGKSLHDRRPGATAVDLNRTGVPLAEIVSEPDLTSPARARAFLDALKRLMEYLEVSDCNMEEGSLRVDANVSVRRPGSDELATKTEVKNMNSFSQLEKALEYEAARHIAILESGARVDHQTMLWDPGRGEARPMRGKEEIHDYRYFPEPDLPPLVLEPARIGMIRDELPELPDRREARFVAEYGLTEYDAGVLTADRATADYFEATAAAAGDPKAASNWVMGEVLAWRNETGQGIDALPVGPDRLGGLIRLADEGTVSSTAAREVFQRMLDDDRGPEEIVDAEGLARVSDDVRLQRWVDDALAEHPDEAGRLRAGEAKLIGFFVGAVMRASGGQADPERVRELLADI